MDVERLARHVEKPSLHRRLLGDYDGPYALGVTRQDDGSAALSLSVASRSTKGFPKDVEIEGERIRVLVHPNWKAPTPL